MLTATSPRLLHILQNLSLIAISLAFLPLNTTLVLLASYLSTRTSRSRKLLRHRDAIRADPTFARRRILVTGVGMTKGLCLAREFWLAGHDVVGADFVGGRGGWLDVISMGLWGAWPCGVVSRAVGRFRVLGSPDQGGSEEKGGSRYVSSLLQIVREERIDLWVSCSGVASAVEDGLAMEVVERETACRAVQFDADTTRVLHEKGSFVRRVSEFGLNGPETKEVTSQGMVLDVLRAAPEGRRYILKTVGMDDSVRGDLTLLPRDSWDETLQHIGRLRITEKTPWIVQQFVDGLEYCTHALIVRGEVKVFVACPSAELLMHYRALVPEEPLSRAMLEFTTVFAAKSGEKFTGHLSFDFLVEREDLGKTDPKDIKLYPIECNPRAHTAVVLFTGTTEMADAYMSVLETGRKTRPSYADVVDEDPLRNIVTPRLSRQYYWSGHDFIALLVLPALQLLMLRISIADFLRGIDEALDHLLTWSDGTFEAWDPLPWWWLYHVYWPFRFLDMLLRGKKWSRVNVSTGKMFEC